ncbi:MAG TPA: TMEM175 family protein [Phenylobacterium sp.]|uniref:TMEM175 family protein n=1 Tax=Phenylobacterium sp. TaxID=1871053 RepID=UPI002B76EFFA|nr:TMEM175 family protein [Phenylobacterium sp.]HSV01800.1 TMEM175 family protein [Phenylobacterium sp.]
MSERDLTPGRLETFSDAVIAIIVTIMVLELRPPASVAWSSLAALWPDFVSYLISFWFVAIFWVNHHHIVRRLSRLTEPVLWANISFLFVLSLIPFATAWVGRSGVAARPMLLYALVIMACGANFALLRGLIETTLPTPQRRAFNGPRVQVVGFATMGLLVTAGMVSFAWPRAALAIVAASSILHMAPLTRH